MRLVEDIRESLRHLLADDRSAWIIGQDLVDPYGGAFKVTKGLSLDFPERVISTPISEQAMIGIAIGIALSGERVVAEVMFSDFLPLVFDQIVNVAAKLPTNYGVNIPIELVIRAPTGGRRGYGSTHSQSLQKHFLGIPNLSVWELSPFHETEITLRQAFATKGPALLFEDKLLYSRNALFTGDQLPATFSREIVDPDGNWVSVSLGDGGETDYVVIATGGTALLALEAIEIVFLKHELSGKLLVPRKLYPINIEQIVSSMPIGARVFTVEECARGASWGSYCTSSLYDVAFNNLSGSCINISSNCSVIPAAKSLEEAALISTLRITESIVNTMKSNSRA